MNKVAEESSTMAAVLLSKLDKNGDGVVSLTEFIDHFEQEVPTPVFVILESMGVNLGQV